VNDGFEMIKGDSGRTSDFPKEVRSYSSLPSRRVRYRGVRGKRETSTSAARGGRLTLNDVD
jgi:hypothetical protein